MIAAICNNDSACVVLNATYLGTSVLYLSQIWSGKRTAALAISRHTRNLQSNTECFGAPQFQATKHNYLAQHDKA